MKNILVLAFVCGIAALSSCGNGGNTPVAVVPVPSSSSNGDTLQISFSTDTMRTFTINDEIVNNVPVYSLYASSIFNATDSLFHLRIQVVDYKMQQMALYIEATNNSATGSYFIGRNSSTFTDYSRGQNRTYAISEGGTVNVTQATSPMRGTFSVYLYYNHDSIPATGNFKIYN